MPVQSQMVPLGFSEFLKGAQNAVAVAIDTESNGLDIRDGRGYGIGISLSYRTDDYVLSDYFPVRHSAGSNITHTQLDELKAAVENLKMVVFHNAKFDLESLKTMGINYTGEFRCTMLIAHLLDENKPFQGKSLDACTKLYLKDEGKKKSEQFLNARKLFGWDMPVDFIYEYACYDTDLTFRLDEYEQANGGKELADYWKYKQDFIRVIAKMESRGVRVDQPLCEKMTAIGENQMIEILDMLGYENLGSNALKELLIDKLGLPEITKKRKNGTVTQTFDKEAMEVYEQILERTDDDTARLILSYRGWQKSVSSNYRPYIELLSPDGRLRPNYKLHGTKTGRMSCEKPNLQQIPRIGEKPWNGQMKQCFIPKPGFTLYEGDYSQLELRLATAYAKESGLKEVFLQDRDVFTEMSETLGMTRFDTKTLTYTIQYGGGVNRISQVFGVSKDRAADIRDNFYRTYPGFRKISQIAQNRAAATGAVKIWSGRKRHFLWPKDEAHKAFNSVIQGGAADIVERTMIRLDKEVDNPDCQMLLQVHDSVVFEIKNGTEDYYLPKIKEVMEAIPEAKEFDVKFKAAIHKWGEEDDIM